MAEQRGAGVQVPAGASFVGGIVALGGLLWLAYQAAPDPASPIILAIDRLVGWVELLLRVLSPRGLFAAGIAYFVMKHKHGHRLLGGALAALAIGYLGLTAWGWLGILFSRLSLQIAGAR